MPIVIPGFSTPNNVGNYSGLIQAIMDELKDDSLEDAIPRFIYLAEARFNRLLYPLNDETTTSLSATVANAGQITLPDDFKKVRTLTYGSGTTATVLAQLSPDDFKSRFLGQSAGVPEAYALAGEKLWVGPTPAATYALSLTYVEGIPSLSTSNQTNWLIDAHPDLYFFGALMYAELNGWNDERARFIGESVNELIAEIRFWDAQRRRGDKIESVPGSYF